MSSLGLLQILHSSNKFRFGDPGTFDSFSDCFLHHRSSKCSGGVDINLF